MRIDRFLANSGMGSRKESSLLIKAGRVLANGKVVSSSALHINPDVDTIEVDGQRVIYKKHIYLMLNKPVGYVSANTDSLNKTVFDLVEDRYAHFDLCCVGRLDKDTEGLIFLTNDGEFAHRLMSPRYSVEKTYFVKTALPIEKEIIKAFEKGVTIEGGYTTRPARLTIISENTASLTITEGKYHQVKLMFKAVGNSVKYLKRTEVGGVKLDEKLEKGKMRELNKEETVLLKEKVGLGVGSRE